MTSEWPEDVQNSQQFTIHFKITQGEEFEGPQHTGLIVFEATEMPVTLIRSSRLIDKGGSIPSVQR